MYIISAAKWTINNIERKVPCLYIFHAGVAGSCRTILRDSLGVVDRFIIRQECQRLFQTILNHVAFCHFWYVKMLREMFSYLIYI